MEKRFVVGLLFALILSVPSALALPFTFEIAEKYSGVHTENLWPCWDKKLAIDLGGVFPVDEVRFKAGYLTGVCDHYHRFAGGIRILLGSSVRDDITVNAVCSKCGYPWNNHDFAGQFASTVEVCGGDDNGGKMTWGGWGGYPYEFTYNRQYELARIDHDDVAYLGEVNEFFDEFSAQEGKPEWSATVSTNNPDVMIWFDDDTTVTETSDSNSIVAACADTNKNKICDFDEKVFTDCKAAGGDWYRGVCCGVDYQECEYAGGKTFTIYVKREGQYITGIEDTPTAGHVAINVYSLYTKSGNLNGGVYVRDTPATGFIKISAPTIYVAKAPSLMGYIIVGISTVPPLSYQQRGYYFDPIPLFDLAGINALCGKNAAGQFEWAAVGEPGEIHELFDCPGGSVISDGTSLYQCGGNTHVNLTAMVQKGFKTAYVNGYMHDYFCIGKNIYECGGSGSPFSSNNAMFTGSVAPGSAITCPAGMIGYWAMDGNTQDSVFGNNGANHGALFGTGKVSQAAIFTGDGRIDIANTPALNPNLLTIEAWVYLPDEQKSGTNTIVHKNGAYQMVLKDGVLKGAIQIEGGPNWALEGTAIVPTGVWNHVAMIYSGSHLSFYLNGNEMDNVPLSGNIQSSSSRLFIGEASDAVTLPSQYAFYGSIDEVAIYDGIVLPEELANHHNSPGNYCPTVSFDVPETYYCASDGDWTKDLDIKDKESCDLSGYDGTGTYCCSEDDDENEYYNDPLGTAKSIDEIMVADSGTVVRTGDNLTLDASGSWAEFAGPAQLHVYEWSERERTAGEFETCKFLGKKFVEIPTGKSRFVYVVEPMPSDPANTNCTLRRKEVVVESTPGHGGCWNKDVINSGNYAPQTSQRVLNYVGQFYGCNITDRSLLALNDSHVPPPATIDDPTNQLINNSVQRCGYVFYDASGDAAEPHLMCSPSGDWQTTDALIGEFEKSVKWTVPINITGIANTGCCAADQCWNGTECQVLHSYYRVLDQGYVCEFAEDVPTVDLPPPPSLCTDSDGGQDYDIRGTVQAVVPGWESGIEDVCEMGIDAEKSNQTECLLNPLIRRQGAVYACDLLEHYCDPSNTPRTERVSCNECKDGVCINPA